MHVLLTKSQTYSISNHVYRHFRRHLTKLMDLGTHSLLWRCEECKNVGIFLFSTHLNNRNRIFCVNILGFSPLFLQITTVLRRKWMCGISGVQGRNIYTLCTAVKVKNVNVIFCLMLLDIASIKEKRKIESIYTLSQITFKNPCDILQ